MPQVINPALVVSHIWLYVADTTRSITFYRDVIGLKITETFPHGALFDGGGVLLGIHRAEGERRSRPGTAVIIVKTTAMEKAYKRLEQRGVIFDTPIRKEPYGMIASFKDPDGYLLELVAEKE